MPPWWKTLATNTSMIGEKGKYKGNRGDIICLSGAPPWPLSVPLRTSPTTTPSGVECTGSDYKQKLETIKILSPRIVNSFDSLTLSRFTSLSYPLLHQDQWLRYISQIVYVDTKHCLSLITIQADAVADKFRQMSSASKQNQSSRSMHVIIYVIASCNRKL